MAVSAKSAPVPAAVASRLPALPQQNPQADLFAAAALIEEANPRLNLGPGPDGNGGIYGAKGKATKPRLAKPSRPHNLRTDFSPSLRLELCVHCEPGEEQEESQ
jgi:hypothetical protein